MSRETVKLRVAQHTAAVAAPVLAGHHSALTELIIGQPVTLNADHPEVAPGRLGALGHQDLSQSTQLKK
jgi:hypothetical protein